MDPDPSLGSEREGEHLVDDDEGERARSKREEQHDEAQAHSADGGWPLEQEMEGHGEDGHRDEQVGQGERVPAASALDEDGSDQLAAELTRAHADRDPEDRIDARATYALCYALGLVDSEIGGGRTRVIERGGVGVAEQLGGVGVVVGCVTLVEDGGRVVENGLGAGELLPEAERESREDQPTYIAITVAAHIHIHIVAAPSEVRRVSCHMSWRVPALCEP